MFVLGFGLGPLGLPEILLILLVLGLLFGAKKLPELGRGIGGSLRGFMKEIRGIKEDGAETSNTISELMDVKKEIDSVEEEFREGVDTIKEISGANNDGHRRWTSRRVRRERVLRDREGK